jgi:organic radical activating enzyme
MNQQPPEPQDKSDGQSLDLHSMFLTIQGEGPFSGRPAVFVRLAGCNLQCPWCDTEYTEGRRTMPVGELVDEVDRLSLAHKKAKLVVLTGGEPLRQAVGRFVMVLLDEGYTVQIESNGVFAPDPWLTCCLDTDFQDLVLVVSPKTHRIHKEIVRFADVFKYVLDAHSADPEDGLPIKALDHPNNSRVARPPKDFKGSIYVNPCDNGDEISNQLNLQACAHSAVKHGYIVGVQLHKLIGVP